MGCDIHGHIEVDKSHNEDVTRWISAGTLFPFVGRSYDAFGCLFGVRNYSNFNPVAPDRGIPRPMSRSAKEDYESWKQDAHSQSFLNYTEIQDIDWDETADEVDARYSVLDENKEPTGTKFALGPASGWNEIVEENKEAIEAGEPVPNESGDQHIQKRKLTRGEALSGAWQWLLHDYMGMLADRFGEENVRVVVWFDN